MLLFSIVDCKANDETGIVDRKIATTDEMSKGTAELLIPFFIILEVSNKNEVVK